MERIFMKRIVSTYSIEEFVSITIKLLERRVLFLPIIHSTKSFTNNSPFCYKAGYCPSQELDKEYIYTIWIFSNKEVLFE